MALRILFAGTVAKHHDSPEDNEDAFRSAPERGRVVLSDGASESFDARGWANLLVDRLIDTDPSDETMLQCIDAYAQLHDPDTLSWSKTAAFARGSFATMVIAQDDPDRRAVTVSALGDSLAVWTDGVMLLYTAPYAHADQFSEKPTLISTRPELNQQSDGSESNEWTHATWQYEDQGYRVLLCMTDALGAWLLRHEEAVDASALERLHAIREVSELVDLVESERASGALRRDDSTLIIATLTASS